MHSTVAFKNKLFIFGGCFAYNHKRQARDTTNSLLQYDLDTKTVKIMKTGGPVPAMRKQHTAVTYKNSMVVYGGYSDAGWVFNDMLAYHFEDNLWAKVSFAQHVPAFYQGAACSVSIKSQHNERKVILITTLERLNSEWHLLLWRQNGQSEIKR